MILHRGSRKRMGILFQPTKAIIEQLERRQLLSTIHGGDIFEYIDATGNTIRAHAVGPASDQYDLIGSNFTNGQFGLNDVPGLVTHPDGTTTEILGGVGGVHGIDLIGDVTGANESLTDLVNPNINNANSPAFGLPRPGGERGDQCRADQLELRRCDLGIQ